MLDQVTIPKTTTATMTTARDVTPTPAAATSKLPRVVYFVASHVCPEQVVRLVRACRSGAPHSRVLLHHDQNVSRLDPSQLAGIDNVDFLSQEIRIVRGWFSMTLMVMKSLRWLLDNRDFDWAVYLSGQDYPLRPLADIERFLGETQYDGFIDVKPVEERSWVIGPQRYLYQYYTLPKFKGWRRVRRWLKHRGEAARQSGQMPRLLIPREPLTRGFRVGVRPLHGGPFRDGFRCYMGSMFWTLNRKAIDSMVRYAEEHPALQRYYHRIQFAPNESFFPTILANDRSLSMCTDDNKRMVRWTKPQTSHPDTFTAADWEQVLATDAHFARKIDQRVDPELLDLLDRRIGVSA